MALTYPFCWLRGYDLGFKHSSDYKLLMFRSSLLTIHTLAISLAQFVLPLPIVHTLNCSSTIFIFIIDYFAYGIKINCLQIIGIGVGFFGVILNTNGALVTKMLYPDYEFESKFQNYLTNDPRERSLFAVFFLIAILGWSYSASCLKSLSKLIMLFKSTFIWPFFMFYFHLLYIHLWSVVLYL